jgi:hypothetical protein
MPYRTRAYGGYPRRPVTHRRKMWISYPFTDNSIASGVLQSHDLLSPYRTNPGVGIVAGTTIMRVHLSAAIGFASAAGNVAIGFQVGIVGQYNPLTQPDVEWMLNTREYANSSAAAVDANKPFKIDLRSRRRVRQFGDTLEFSWVPTDTGTVSMTGFFRILVMQP